MTVPSTSRSAGPFNGNASTTTFPFTFKVFDKTNIQVLKVAADGTQTTLVLDSDYSVSVNADQVASPGGTVTYPISGSPLPVGATLSITGALDYSQTTSLAGGGNFSPTVIEQTFDRIVILVQQLYEKVSRAIRFPASDSANTSVLPVASLRANKALIFDASGNVGVSVDDYVDQLANVTAQASSASASASSASASAASASSSASSASSSATSAAASLASLLNHYMGAYASDPAHRPDGTALQQGDAYFNSTSLLFMVYNGATFQASDINTANLAAGSGASLIGFIQAATGAVARTAQARMRDWISVKDFGAVGDGTTDDTAAINAAITFAALTSRVVYFPAGTYKYTSTLNVPAGVVLMGEVRGNIVNTTPTTGSILSYTGTADAVSLNGTLCGLERLAIVGTSAALGAGVLVNGNGNVVESWWMRHITIYGFTGGTGLKLNGVNSGAVAYGSAFDVRIRHAKTGLWIVDVGGASGFCNTNQFYGGAISGGGFDYAIRLQGGNDNRIYGMSVEPPSSNVGHIVIETGALTFDGRLEGSTLPATVPIINVWNTAGFSTIKGMGGAGTVLNQGGAAISMTSGKHAEALPPSDNAFANPGFAGTDVSAHTITDWTVVETGSATTWTLDTSVIVPGYQAIQIVVPAGANVELKPATPPTLPSNSLSNATFGMWVKTSAAQSAYARINAPAGVTQSADHSGSGSWEEISMQQAFSGTLDVRFELPGGGSGATYVIAAPYFTYGTAQPRNAAHLKTSGGVVYGTFEGGTYTISLPASGDSVNYTSATSELTAPKWGNTVHIAGTARTITRLNNLAANRWAKGTQMLLVFDIGSVGVTNGAYITLTAAFTSAAPANNAARNWLLLESNGDGTWYELDRR